jgi:hypothetical protein
MTELKIVVTPMNDNIQQPTLKIFFSKAEAEDEYPILADMSILSKYSM